MTDLKIPNLNKNSDKYFFKKKLTLRRKSKSKLIKESFVMLFLSFLIIYFNYLIPNKKVIFSNLLNNISELIVNIQNSLDYIFEISLTILIVVSLIFALILILGSFSRILKVVRRKTSLLKFK